MQHLFLLVLPKHLLKRRRVLRRHHKIFVKTSVLFRPGPRGRKRRVISVTAGPTSVLANAHAQENQQGKPANDAAQDDPNHLRVRWCLPGGRAAVVARRRRSDCRRGRGWGNGEGSGVNRRIQDRISQRLRTGRGIVLLKAHRNAIGIRTVQEQHEGAVERWRRRRGTAASFGDEQRVNETQFGKGTDHPSPSSSRRRLLATRESMARHPWRNGGR